MTAWQRTGTNNSIAYAVNRLEALASDNLSHPFFPLRKLLRWNVSCTNIDFTTVKYDSPNGYKRNTDFNCNLSFVIRFEYYGCCVSSDPHFQLRFAKRFAFVAFLFNSIEICRIFWNSLIGTSVTF